MTMTLPNRIRLAEANDFQTNGELLRLLRCGDRLGADTEFFPQKLPLRDRLGIMLALAASSWSFVLILFRLVYLAVAS
jgi:hypothetical protein